MFWNPIIFQDHAIISTTFTGTCLCSVVCSVTVCNAFIDFRMYIWKDDPLSCWIYYINTNKYHLHLLHYERGNNPHQGLNIHIFTFKVHVYLSNYEKRIVLFWHEKCKINIVGLYCCVEYEFYKSLKILHSKARHGKYRYKKHRGGSMRATILP